MRFTKEVLRSLRPEIDAALAAVAKKHGFELKLGNVTFDDLTFRGQLQARCVEELADGTVITPEAAAFNRLADLVGLKVGDLGRAFYDDRGRTHRIVGAKSTSRRLWILTRCADRTWKWPASVVVSKLATSPL